MITASFDEDRLKSVIEKYSNANIATIVRICLTILYTRYRSKIKSDLILMDYTDKSCLLNFSIAISPDKQNRESNLLQ